MLPQGSGCEEFEKPHRHMHQEMKLATRKSNSAIFLNLLLTCVCTEPGAPNAEHDALAAAKHRKNNAAKDEFSTCRYGFRAKASKAGISDLVEAQDFVDQYEDAWEAKRVST
jgi:hypothetical protein